MSERFKFDRERLEFRRDGDIGALALRVVEQLRRLGVPIENVEVTEDAVTFEALPRPDGDDVRGLSTAQAHAILAAFAMEFTEGVVGGELNCDDGMVAARGARTALVLQVKREYPAIFDSYQWAFGNETGK